MYMYTYIYICIYLYIYIYIYNRSGTLCESLLMVEAFHANVVYALTNRCVSDTKYKKTKNKQKQTKK